MDSIRNPAATGTKRPARHLSDWRRYRRLCLSFDDAFLIGNSDFMNVNSLYERYPALACCENVITQAYHCLREAVLGDQHIYLCGNGGSASDAEHWAGELLKGFLSERPLPDSERKCLPPTLADKLQWGIPAIPLTGFPSFSTAFSNDVESSMVFAQLVHVLGRKGDILIAISTSGNSLNTIHAAEAAAARKMSVIALTGEGGGALRELADITVAVPASETPAVQELHLPIYHHLSALLEQTMDQHFAAKHDTAEIRSPLPNQADSKLR